MSVFIELTIDDFQRTFLKQVEDNSYSGGRRGGAGEPNVRRPLRGIEIKDDTYATMRVVQADGTEIPLFDSSDSAGTSNRYSNFLLQSVQEQRMEKQQIVETFGDPYIYFFGEAPRFINCSAILLNTLDFNWRAEWWQNYDKYLRGTKLVEQGARCYLFYDEIVLEGYIVSAAAVETAEQPYFVQLQFQMFLTNYANISLIGDPFYPTRDSAQVPEGIDLTSADAISKLTPKARGRYPQPGDMAAEVYTAYLKQVGAIQIQQQIANAQSIEQAQKLQRDYQLQQLGLGTDILGALGDAFKDTLNAIKGKKPATDNRSLGSIFASDVASAVSKEASKAAADLKQQFKKNFQMNPDPNGFGGEFNLADVLRRAVFYSTPYPGQNIDAFIQNAQFNVFEGQKPSPTVQRNFPFRSLISDNYDEYTKPEVGQGSAADIFKQRFGQPIGPSKDPYNQIDQEMCKRGAQASAQTYYAFGLVSWSPGQGFSSSSGSGSLPGTGVGFGSAGGPLGFGGGQGGAVGFGGTGNGPASINPNYLPAGYGGYVLGFGKGFKPSFSRTPGSTPGVGGAYGGMMGGGIGPGVGGALGGYGASSYGNPNFPQAGSPMAQTFNQNPIGNPSGDPYGLGFTKYGPNTTTSYPFTGGYAPDGTFKGGIGPGGGGKFAGAGFGGGFGAGGGVGKGGSGILGGGANVNAVAGFGVGIKGTGAFGMQSVPGSLDPTGQGGGSANCDSNATKKNSATL